MGFMDEIKAKARADRKRIVLPETEDERTYRAVAKAIEEDIADIILIGKADVVAEKEKEYGVDLSKATVIDPEKSDKLQSYIDKLVELRKKHDS